MVLSKFMPSNPKFSQKFAEAARNAHATATALVDLLENYTDVDAKVQKVRDLEHEGDRLTGEITNQLAELARIAREIRALEDQGDTVSDEVQRHLYDGVNDVPGMIRAMRGGEIVALIEDASDQAQRVAKTVESILLKNA